jgi:hypothetical protein
MPRKVRIQYPGAVYHLMSRGNRREDIFLDDVDRQDFLKTLAEAYAASAAYGALGSHLVIWTNRLDKPGPLLVAFDSWGEPATT